LKRLLRAVWRLDRSYVFAVSALVASIAASVYLSFAKIFVEDYTDGTSQSFTALDYYGNDFLILLILPLVITAGPLLVLPREKQQFKLNHRINSIVTSFVLTVFVAFGFFVTGIYYVPALIFSIASSASLFFGKDRKPASPGAVGGAVRLSGRDKREQRAERRARVTGTGGGKRRRKGS
jgi:hypothetical protein